jgi:hypothetical protein
MFLARANASLTDIEEWTRIHIMMTFIKISIMMFILLLRDEEMARVMFLAMGNAS